MQFLVDTGADVSVIPPSPFERKHPQSLCLEAVNHTSIPTYGTRSLTLNLGLRRTFHWAFIIADVRKPILGADFLHHFSLLVDIKHHKLMDGLTHLHIQGIAAPDPSLSPTLQSHKPTNKFEALLRDFPSVTQPCISERPVQHNVTHHIRTSGPPVSVRARRLASPLNDSKLPVVNSSTCSSWVSSAPLPALGHPPYTWSPRKHQETGVPAETIVLSTTVLSQIATPFLTSRISPPRSMEPPSSASWIWSVLITRFRWNQTTYQRLP